MFLALVLVLAVSNAAIAEDAETVAVPATVQSVETVQTNLNIVWTCVAAFLVFFMQPGFAMVEVGFQNGKHFAELQTYDEEGNPRFSYRMWDP